MKKKPLALSFVVLVTFGLLISSQAAKTSHNLANQFCTSEFPCRGNDTVFVIIPSSNNTYGYEIRVKNKALIKQLTIPSVQGTTGFKTKTDAEKVALLVIKKMSQGIMPPTISRQELEQLEINY